MAEHANVTHWAISLRMCGKGDIFDRLRRGGDVRTATYEELMGRFTGQQVQKFEDDHELMRRIAGGAGSTSPYDWDGMMSALIVRVHEKGLPATQSELIEDMQAWFAEQSADGQFPDERSIRRRISAVWKTLSQLRHSA